MLASEAEVDNTVYSNLVFQKVSLWLKNLTVSALSTFVRHATSEPDRYIDNTNQSSQNLIILYHII